jgi:hypothetical protein
MIANENRRELGYLCIPDEILIDLKELLPPQGRGRMITTGSQGSR